jgi:hypothetical protein
MTPDKNRQVEIIGRYVREFRRAEVDLVGNDTANDLIEATVEGEKLEIDREPTRGRTNDTIEAVKLIFDFAGFIKTVYDIYKLFRDRNKKTPTVEELINAVQEATGKSMSGDKRDVTEKIRSDLTDEIT